MESLAVMETNSQTSTSAATSAPTSATDRLLVRIGELLAPLGYEIVHLEMHNGRQKILRLFIDHLEAGDEKGVGIEDCVAVTRALSEPLDTLEELTAIFKDSSYELEVSSPGVDRPLRRERDYLKFQGREVRIHVYRPLNGEELENAPYADKNPRQKNFLGRLNGLRNGKVLLSLTQENGEKHKKKKNRTQGAAPETTPTTEVAIPLPMIAKANLEPHFNGLHDNS
jgi:ribosome maturation factor RimP